MTQLIGFTEENVDGCGTNVEITVELCIDRFLTKGDKERLVKAIKEIKEGCIEDDWDTDDIIRCAMKKVFGGCANFWYVYPDIEITF